MSDVFSTTRPARPNLAIVLSAAVLLLTLSAALMQVRASRALGPAVKIPGTQLTVRPPRGWEQLPDNPGTFMLLVRGDRAGLQEAIDKQIRFDAGKMPIFVPPQHFFDPDQIASDLVPRKIGGLPGLQARRRVARRFRHLFSYQDYVKETVVRVAVSPRGDFIRIEYDPLTELTTADEELFNDICAAVELDERGLTTAAAEALRNAGVEWAIPAGATVAGPEIAEARGFYAGMSEQDAPVWSIGVFRTWLSAGRTVSDLAREFAEAWWQQAVDGDDITLTTRGDGAAVAAFVHARKANRNPLPIVSVRFVSAAANRAAMILCCASPAAADAADQIAAAAAENIRFTDDFPANDDAEARGAELAAGILKDGPAHWWAARGERLYYLGARIDLAGTKTYDAFVTQRRPRDDARTAGYEGDSLVLRSRYQEREQWEMAADGVEYDWLLETVKGLGSGAPIEVREKRAAGSSTVSKEFRYSGGAEDRRRSRRVKFDAPPNFLSPPLEEIAEVEAARAPDGLARVFRVSTELGDGTHGRVLMAIKPDADKRPRALLVEDYSPQGIVLAFDEDGELAYQSSPGLTLERTTRAEVLKKFSGMRW